MISTKRLLLLIILFFAAAGTVIADICIEEKISAITGGDTIKGIRRTYIAKNKLMLQDPAFQLRIIFDYDNNKVYSINDSGKDISVYTQNNFIMPVNTEFYSDFTHIKESDIHIKESGNKKQIGKYNCFEIVIFIPKAAAMTNIWLTTAETPFAQHYAFLEKYGSVLIKKILPLMKEKNACIADSRTVIVRPKEQEKYQKTELLKISKEEIPAAVFSLPEDYRIININ